MLSDPKPYKFIDYIKRMPKLAGMVHQHLQGEGQRDHGCC